MAAKGSKAGSYNDWITSKDMRVWYTPMIGKQLFRQYDLFNQDTFLDYLT